jgi:hypothetical protein
MTKLIVRKIFVTKCTECLYSFLAWQGFWNHIGRYFCTACFAKIVYYTTIQKAAGDKSFILKCPSHPNDTYIYL